MQRLESEVARVTNETFYADLAHLDIEVIRQRKEEAERVEEMVSYARRITQGRLDTLGFDPNQLQSVQGEPDSEAISRLSSAIGSGTTPQSGFGRFVDTSISDRQIDEVEEEISALMARFTEQEDGGDAEAMLKVEQMLSDWRRVLFLAIDAIRAELVVRYRGDASMVDDLIAKVLQDDK